VIKDTITAHSPGDVICDVGNGFTDVIYAGEFKRRVAVNLQPMPEREGVETIIDDWMNVHIDADVIVCSQVIEHFVNPLPFVRRLFSSGKIVIISVPYMWPKGMEPSHRQDPITRKKLNRLIGKEPKRAQIVQDGRARRLVAVYDGTRLHLNS